MMGEQLSKILAFAATSFRSTSSRRALLVIGLLVVLALFYESTYFSILKETYVPRFTHGGIFPGNGTSKAFVVASMKKDDTRWIPKLLPDWQVYRYITDDAYAKYTVPKNKGREAMVYLTYIIDNYQSLPDLTVFIHGERYQWHNDDPIYDGYHMLQNLQTPYLLENGYTNIRCVWTLGCPAELHDLTDTPLTEAQLQDEKSAMNTQLHFPAAFHELFPGVPLPSTIGVACCAQFAVTRTKIHERPVGDYIRYRNWLLDTPMTDHISGRVFEYSWHIIFGQQAVHCPNAMECYCKVFGYCDLECGQDAENSCGERWPFPPSATLPDGWPGVAWDGAKRTKEEIDNLRFVAYRNSSEIRGATSAAG